MIYAIDKAGQKIRANKELSGRCPCCSEKLIPKCGEIKIWHWAHYAKPDCDSWHEPMSEWHFNWQDRLPSESTEKKIIKGDQWHRADYVRPDGMVVEFQYSPLSTEELKKREEFYGFMIWVFNVIEPYESERLVIWQRSKYSTFRWYHPRKFIFHSSKMPFGGVWFDVGDSLLKIQKAYSEETPYGGWGHRIGYDDFLDYIVAGGGYQKLYSWQVLNAS